MCNTSLFLVQMFQETNIAMLTEDQTNQLLSSFWIQANQTDNTPFNCEAIGILLLLKGLFLLSSTTL